MDDFLDLLIYSLIKIALKTCVSGPDLLFVIYPLGLANLPSPAVWAFLFFLMVFTLGLDSQVRKRSFFFARRIPGDFDLNLEPEFSAFLKSKLYS